MVNYFEKKLFSSESELIKLISKHGTLSIQEKKILFKSAVEIVNLEMSSNCNRKCDYCPVSDSNRSSVEDNKEMPENIFLSILGDLQEINYSGAISLNLYNEPLAYEKFPERLLVIRKAVPNSLLHINTNGDYLTKTLFFRLVKGGLNSINLTIHPAPNKSLTYKQINTRVRRVIKIIDPGYEHDFDIAVQKEKFYEFYSYGIRIRIQWPDWRIDGTYRGGTVPAILKIANARVSPCARPFREFTIYYDGAVTPCCEVFYDGVRGKKELMGLVGDQDIFAIYTSQSLNSFRRHVFDYSKKEGVCAHCTYIDFSAKEDSKKRADLLNI